MKRLLYIPSILLILSGNVLANTITGKVVRVEGKAPGPRKRNGRRGLRQEQGREQKGEEQEFHVEGGGGRGAWASRPHSYKQGKFEQEVAEEAEEGRRLAVGAEVD